MWEVTSPVCELETQAALRQGNELTCSRSEIYDLNIRNGAAPEEKGKGVLLQWDVRGSMHSLS